MKRLVAGLGFAAMLSAPALAISPEIIDVAGVQATRIVIAPPQTDLARTIQQGLKRAYANASGARAYDDALQLYYFYGARHFQPLWLDESADGAINWSLNAEKIRAALESAAYSGLNPDDYVLPRLGGNPASLDPDALARLETAFSDVALRYAQDLHGGRVDPAAISGYMTVRPPKLNATETLMALASANDPLTYLQGLEPTHREYLALKTALADQLDGRIEQAITIPDGGMLRPGMSDARLPLLRERLNLPASPESGAYYDDATVAAVEAFQNSLGLIVDGIVGPATVAALNGGEATSAADIVANMERWRWLPRDLGDYYVFVNIPEFRLAIMDEGEVAYTTRVVTGTPKNQTPIFSDEIEHIVVNPYWNVPRSIAVNEIGPQLASNPGYIASHNMELLYGGRVVDASAVDWSATSVSNFRIRQRPGASNALGSVKFLFPNQHDVYLHDTPSKSLFARSYRAFSHGCVRVQNPWEFAAALLSHEPEVQIASLESQRGSSERWNNLANHIPVHIMYFTLRVDEDGTIHSYGDVYGHNERMKALLGA